MARDRAEINADLNAARSARDNWPGTSEDRKLLQADVDGLVDELIDAHYEATKTRTWLWGAR